jgi:hypothetical protein
MLGLRSKSLRFGNRGALITPLILLGAFAVLAHAITGGVTRDLKLAGLIVVGIAVSLRVMNDWRNGFYLFIIWLLFEDLARKYSGNAAFMFFGKDVLAAVTYLGLFLDTYRRRAATFRPPFLLTLIPFCLWGAAQAFNPNSWSILFGLLGLKLDYFYIPLMFVGYALLRTEKDLRKLLVANVLLGGIIAFLGIVQGVAGLDSFLTPANMPADLKALGHLTRVAPISGLTLERVTSVFVSDGRFSSYLNLVLILGLGTVGYMLLKRRREQYLVFPALAMVVVAGVMSGSRGNVAYMAGSALILSAGMFWNMKWQLGKQHNVVRAVRRSFAIVAAALWLAVVLFPSQIGARLAYYSETLSPESSYFEGSYRAWDYPLNNFYIAWEDPEWLMGHGLGMQSLGTQYVRRIAGTDDPGLSFGVENGYGSILQEVGILGLVIWVALTIQILLRGWNVVWRLKKSPTFPVALSIWFYAGVFLVPWTWGSLAMYQNYILNAYFWLLLGVLFRLPSLPPELPAPAANEATPTVGGNAKTPRWPAPQARQAFRPLSALRGCDQRGSPS